MIVWIYLVGCAVALVGIPILIYHWTRCAEPLDVLFLCVGTLAGAVFWPIAGLSILIVVLYERRMRSTECSSCSQSLR